MVTIAQSVLRGGPHGGQEFVNGATLAIEEAQPRLQARFTIKHVVGDILRSEGFGWDGAREVAFAKRMAADDTVVAYLAPNPSGAASHSLPILNQAGIATVGVSNTYPGFTNETDPDYYATHFVTGKRNYVRVVPSDDVHAVVAARWMTELGAKRVFIIADTDLFGRAIAIDVGRQLGTRIVGNADMPNGPMTAEFYTEIATRVADSKADFVYCGCWHVGKALGLVKELGLNPRTKAMAFMGVDFLAAVKAPATSVRVYVTYPGLALSSYDGDMANWLARYTKRFGEAPKNHYATFAYDAATVVLDALDAAGAQRVREEVLEHVLSRRRVASLLGFTFFDEHGDPNGSVYTGAMATPDGWRVEKVWKEASSEPR